MTEEQITSTHPRFDEVRETLASVWDPKRPEHRLVYRVPFERAWLVDGALQFELFAWDGDHVIDPETGEVVIEHGRYEIVDGEVRKWNHPWTGQQR